MTVEDFELTKEVFLHDFVNPPARTDNMTTIWTPILVNSGDTIKFTDIRPAAQTRLSLQAKESLQLGFTSREPRIVEEEINNLILSFNFELKNCCMTNTRAEYSPAQIQLKPREQKSKNEQQENNKITSILDEIAILESVHVVLGKQESIDERNVIERFKKLQNLDRKSLKPSSPTWQLNLEHALNEFEQGMSTLNKIFKFKHLYNAIEFATNENGDRAMERGALDTAVCSLTRKLASNAPDQARVRDWRRFYNRLKHPGETTNDATTYEQGKQNLDSWLPQIRAFSVTILLERMKKL